MHKTAILLAAALLIVTPFTQAHGAPNPIEAEDLILDDEATDTTIAWDGFDIQTVHLREAYLTGEHGIVVRWTLWGSVALGGAEEETLTLAFDELESPLAWFSEDNGRTWTGSGTVLEVEFETDTAGASDIETGQEIPTNNVQFQAFVPFADLPVATGDALTNAVAYAYADDVAVDVAPGGYYAHGIPQELQDPGASSERALDTLALDGPDRYTLSNITYHPDDGTLSIDVQNLISVSGQHIFAKTSLQPTGLADEHDEAGQHVAGGIEANPGEDVDFTIPMDDFDVIQVFVETDLGGQETFWVRSDGTVHSSEPLSLEDDAVDTPTVPIAFVALAALALVAVLRRR